MTKRENTLAAFEHRQPQWVPVINLDCQLIPTQEINDRPLFEDGKDWFGIQWALGEDRGYMTHVRPGQRILSDISDWRKEITFPDCKNLPWDQMAVRTNKIWHDREQRCGYIVCAIGAFERINILMDGVDGLCAMYDDFEAYKDFVNAYADYRIEQFDYFHEYLKPDFLLMHDDWGSQNNMQISPELWRKIYKEPERRMTEKAHSLGIKYVHHSCGKIEQIIPDFVELGMDGWHSVQPLNNLDYIKNTYGDKITFLGGVDSQVTDMPGVSEEIVRADVRRAIDTLGKGGGYLCSSSVMFSTDPEVERIINDEASVYGQHFY